MIALNALWRMSRPMQLGAVLLVYLAGTVMARAAGVPLDPMIVLWGLAALLPAAASIHYANEYSDAETDALTTRTNFSGGSGVLARGLVSRSMALWAAWSAAAVGISVAIGGIIGRTLPLTALILLIIGIIFGWMYSLPPLKLAWRGWGELDNALLGGLLLPLYGYTTASGTISLDAIQAWLPFTLVVFINLLATTWSDRAADAAVGKYTLATRWRVFWLRMVYVLAGGMAFICLFAKLPTAVATLSLFAAPFALVGALSYTRWHNPAPSVLTMLVLLLAQISGWLSMG